MKNKAFTLAEVLITLAVIGIIAAMTLPDLVKNYQKKMTVAKLQKAYSVLSQMLLKSFADNGAASDYLTTGQTASKEEAIEYFNTYWLQYFKSPRVAAQGKTLYETTTPFKYLKGGTYGISITTNYASPRILFQTSDGIIYWINVQTWVWEYDDDGELLSQTSTYADTALVWVDINGTKGPNTMGKDVFRFYINLDSNKILPFGYGYSMAVINSQCSTSYQGYTCAAKIMRDGWKIKDDYPW